MNPAENHLDDGPEHAVQGARTPLRVAMICQRDDVASGGAARVAAELTKRLAASGIEAICIFAYGKPGGISRDIRANSRWLGIGSERGSLLGFFRLRRAIRDFRPDVIYHHDGLTWTHFVSWTFPRTLVIGHAHLDGPQASASGRRRLAHWVHVRTYRHLVAVSEFTRKRWIELGFSGGDSVVLSNGVDGSVFRPATPTERSEARVRFEVPPEANVVVSVGRLHSGMKGTDDFLRVLSRLGPAWHGLVAGDGPDREVLEQLATELGLSDRVHFVGLVDPISPVYHAADVLAITSRYEPFGLIAVEALASGLPVVGFECRGGVVEILAGAGQPVIGGRDLDAMAKAIENARGKELAERAALLERYNWDSTARKLAARLHDWVGPR